MSGELPLPLVGWLPDDAEILRQFPVLHSGWELDEHAWLVRHADGRIAVVLTSHNSPFEADEARLLALIARCMQATTSAIEALAALRTQRDPSRAEPA